MGTALVVCLSYWMGVSMLVFFISYLVTAHLSLLQVLSLVVSDIIMMILVELCIEHPLVNIELTLFNAL